MRAMEENQYRQTKKDWFAKLVHAIKQPEIKQGTPVFVADGARRRAEMAFIGKKANWCWDLIPPKAMILRIFNIVRP